MKRHIKLNFVDFWDTFDPFNNYFYNLLKKYYSIEISDDPDFVICSSFGKDYRKYKCIRILYTGENTRPNFHRYDYAFSFDYTGNPNNYRLPFYAFYINGCDLVREADVDFEKIMAEKTEFCNFVYSNPKARKRVKFFQRLSKYKRVDSGGRYLNNIGSPVVDKLEFIKKYKFTIAFENFSYPGYTSEKIVEPLKAYSLPIYWGNSLVHRDFNTKSFLNYYDFENENALIEKIIELDRNDDLYLDYLKQPCFHGNKTSHFLDPESVIDHFNYLFNNSKKPVAQSSFDRVLSIHKNPSTWVESVSGVMH